MIFEVWFAVTLFAVLATLASVRGFGLGWLVAGVAWLIASFTSGDIEFMVVYDASDYLKVFYYPFLVQFFGLVGVAHLLCFFVVSWRFLRERVDSRDGLLG